MILVKPSFEVMAIMGKDFEEYGSDTTLHLIEKAARTCYKSEAKTTMLSANNFVKSIIERGHESVIEHSAMTVKFICDRGVTHELVRHRLCAFSQESTRYCNYKGGVTFVIPPWNEMLKDVRISLELNSMQMISDYCQHPTADEAWLVLIARSEEAYQYLLNSNWTPQQARSVLPNSLKTEIVVTANFREWRHIFKLRCSKAAHPQMREIMIPLYEKCKDLIPVIFDDLEV